MTTIALRPNTRRVGAPSQGRAPIAPSVPAFDAPLWRSEGFAEDLEEPLQATSGTRREPGDALAMVFAITLALGTAALGWSTLDQPGATEALSVAAR